MQKSLDGMGVDHPQAANDSLRGAEAQQPTERAANGTSSTRSITSAVSPVGGIPAPVASSGPAIGGESDLGVVLATATAASPDVQAADGHGTIERNEPTGTQIENGDLKVTGQKEDNGSHQKEDLKPDRGTLSGEKPEGVESPQQAIEEKASATPAP